MEEPLWCSLCGAYDNECECGWPTEETPKEAFKYCEICGAEAVYGEACKECGL